MSVNGIKISYSRKFQVYVTLRRNYIQVPPGLTSGKKVTASCFNPHTQSTATNAFATHISGQQPTLNNE